MAACEKCWGDAYVRSLSDTSKTQYEHYKDLVMEREREGSPCATPPHEDNGAEGFEAIFDNHFKSGMKDGHPNSFKEAYATLWQRVILPSASEYASNERNRAIHECIDVVKKEQLDTPDHFGYVACDNILEELSKLKT